MKMVVDLPPPGVTSPYKQQSQLSAQQRPCACSTDSLDQEKPRYEPNQLGRDGSLKTFRTFTPKRPVRTVHFTEDATDSPSSRQTLPASLSMKSREPRFQPQFQSMRPRSNPTHPANAVSDYVGGGGSGGNGGLGFGSSQQQLAGGAYGDLGIYVNARRDQIADSLNDSADTADEGNTTTTSGSYTIDQDDVIQELQSDIFV
nr:hypothetical protein BaRGS_014491 [Batillaria attramentaria]